MLQLHDVRKSYGSKVAVDGISLAVAPGEVLGLLGPNGAGKTTTISMAVGLLEPDSGTIEVGNLGPPTRRSARAQIGVATQMLALYDEMSALENLVFFGRMQGLSGQRLSDRASACLDLVGLSDVARDRVSTFSGGMKRRLNLAVAVVHEPRLILLDEPTVGVDPQSRNAIFERVLELRAEGRAVVYTTHYMEEAQRLCDRIAIVDHGRLLGLDTVAALVRAHGGPGVLVVSSQGADERIATNDPVAALAAIQSERTVDTFRYDPPSLETVFLELTGRQLRD